MFCADIGSSETECTDRLTVEEDGRQLLSVCGEKQESIVIESDGGGLDVFVSIRSKNIFPKRGVLFQYKGQLLFSDTVPVNNLCVIGDEIRAGGEMRENGIAQGYENYGQRAVHTLLII
jgi:hypothetical protein